MIKDKLQVLPFGLRASNVSIEGENTLISTLPLARTSIEAFDRETGLNVLLKLKMNLASLIEIDCVEDAVQL